MIFLEKTVIPFCTHEGSALGSSESDIAEVGTAYAELYGLYLNGQLFSKDDYLEASKYIPAARRSRRCACMSRTTATCGANTALPPPATSAPATG